MALTIRSGSAATSAHKRGTTYSLSPNCSCSQRPTFRNIFCVSFQIGSYVVCQVHESSGFSHRSIENSHVCRKIMASSISRAPKHAGKSIHLVELRLAPNQKPFPIEGPHHNVSGVSC